MEQLNNNLSKIQQIFSNKKVRYAKNIFCICAALICSLLCAMSKEVSLDQLGSTMTKKIESRTLSAENMTYINYSQADNTFISSSNDPQIIADKINEYVDNIDIGLTAPLDTDVNIQVFYSTDKSGFTEENSLKQLAYKGDTNIKIELKKTVTSFRMDIGTEPNIAIALNEVAINKDISLGFQPLIKKLVSSKVFWLRFEIFSLLFLFISLHFILNLKRMYQFIYKYRWAIGLAIVVLMTVNKLHGDSTAMYDSYVQPGAGSEFVQPIIGEARAIRSDEWLTNTSRIVSSRYLDNPCSEYNNIIRGTDTHNLTAVNFSTIGHNTLNVFYRILGIEYGFYFIWNLKIVFSLLITFEFFMILCDKKKLISLLSTCMIICSAFFLWWQFPSIIMWAHASIVCFYYFFKTNCRRTKLLCALGTPLATANFVLILYPAWQVPMGFVVLAILSWIIYSNWNDVKKQKIKSWFLFGVALFFLAALVFAYMRLTKDYTKIISETVYPGDRVSTGGYAWNKLLYYVQCFVYPFKDVGNPSELATLCTFFPLPIVIGVFYVIKEKGKDWLADSLLIVLALLLCYTSVGIPSWLAKITMLTRSTPERTADVVGIACIYLMAVILSKKRIIQSKKYWIAAIAISVATISIAVYTSITDYKDYLECSTAIILVIVLSIFATTLLYQYKTKTLQMIYSLMIVIFVFIGLQVRPVQRGFDAIDSKPIATAIKKINASDPNQKWLAAGGLVSSAYSISCGSPTINSVATYPNMTLWKALDQTGQYSDIYNRFEHIVLGFTEQPTSFKLIQPDTISWQLSYADIKKTKAKYILTDSNVNVDNQYVSLQKLYGELGCYIYKINYK